MAAKAARSKEENKVPKLPSKKTVLDAYQHIVRDSQSFPNQLYTLLDMPRKQCFVTTLDDVVRRMVHDGWTVVCRIQNGKEV